MLKSTCGLIENILNLFPYVALKDDGRFFHVKIAEWRQYDRKEMFGITSTNQTWPGLTLLCDGGAFVFDGDSEIVITTDDMTDNDESCTITAVGFWLNGRNKRIDEKMPCIQLYCSNYEAMYGQYTNPIEIDTPIQLIGMTK